MKVPQNDHHQLHAIHQMLKIHSALFWPSNTENKEENMKISIPNNKQPSYSRRAGKTVCSHASLWINVNLFTRHISCLSDKFCTWKLLWFWKALLNSSQGYFNISIRQYPIAFTPQHISLASFWQTVSIFKIASYFFTIFYWPISSQYSHQPSVTSKCHLVDVLQMTFLFF